jgi:hypothetical protein
MNKKLEKTQKEINELRGLQQTPNWN